MMGLQNGAAGISVCAMRTKSYSMMKADRFVSQVFGQDVHVKRVASLAAATIGAINAAVLGVQAIGLALAQARGLDPKHAIKQVDRLLSNSKLEMLEMFAVWVPFAIGAQRQIRVAMDWTDFDKDHQATIALSLLTRHGRSTALMWFTVFKDELKDCRNAFEDLILTRFKAVLPPDVKVTIVADRGFGDVKLYGLLRELGFDYAIRFRGNVLVKHDGVTKPAAEWVGASGRARMLKDVVVTGDRVAVPAVVLVHAPKMKDPWCIATSLSGSPARDVVRLYGKRFTIEEQFRDTKDLHFGHGLSATSISNTERRDRLLLIGALATALLTLLGAAGERTGLDRRFRANTSKTRTHSLPRQGSMYYGAIPTMRPEWLGPLIREFNQMLDATSVFSTAFGLL